MDSFQEKEKAWKRSRTDDRGTRCKNDLDFISFSIQSLFRARHAAPFPCRPNAGLICAAVRRWRSDSTFHVLRSRMILYLVRHGESAFNAAGRIQGQLDPPLSELGQRQGQALAAALATLPIEAVYCSPLQRAMQTAAPLAAELKLELRTLDGLKELNAGIFQGKTWPEVHDEFPAEAARWTSQDPDFRIPQGESRRELMSRGRAAFDTIRECGCRQVAVVAHGGILAAALKAMLEVPPQRNPFSFFNASISKLAWDGQVKLLTLNQIEHLRRPDGTYDTRSGDL
jgi:2,3-bisphosphoglycerate-dependent phosphoglycerate mutase